MNDSLHVFFISISKGARSRILLTLKAMMQFDETIANNGYMPYCVGFVFVLIIYFALFPHSLLLHLPPHMTPRKDEEGSSISSPEGEKCENERRSRFPKVSRRWWITMGIFLTALTLGLGLGPPLGLKHNRGNTDVHDAVVDLGYSSYRGKVLEDGTSRWLGMRYAAAPVGQLRFAAPQDPERTTTIQAADKVSWNSTEPKRLV